MALKFSDIVEAFEFVSYADWGEYLAYINKETGQTYWYSEINANEEELPEDIDNEKYLEIPHKSELDLGKKAPTQSSKHFSNTMTSSINGMNLNQALRKKPCENGVKCLE